MRRSRSCLLTTLLFVARIAGATDLNNVPPLKDTYVSQNTGGTNYGAVSTVILGTTISTEVVYLQYDLSSIPTSATVVTTTLTFQKAFTNATGTYVATMRRRSAAWSELGVTWNNSTPPGDAIVGSASINPALSFPTITDGPLKTLVSEWVASPGTNVGLALYPAVADGKYISFYSKEDTSGKVPIRLSVTYSLPAPGVTTNAASGVGQSSVTLNGTVNPNGGSTTTAFDYGFTSSYGSQVSAQTLSGTTPQSISAPVTGLTCGTLYHFRARATNSGGTTSGGDVTFMTSSCPCTYTISPTSSTVGSAAGTGSIVVTSTPAVCTGGSWSAAETSAWISLTGTTSGTGSGSWTTGYSYTTNSGAQRSDAVTFSGATNGPFTLTQDAPVCGYTGCGSHAEHQAARTAVRSGRRTSSIAGPQRSLSASALS